MFTKQPFILRLIIILKAATYAEEYKLGTTDVGEIAKSIAMLPKENGSKGRLVVITQVCFIIKSVFVALPPTLSVILQGSDPVVVVQQGKVLKFPVEKLAASKIVDTNGAGDAFVGGFLAQYVQNKPLEVAVR